MKDNYILQKDLIIPKGTEIYNDANNYKEEFKYKMMFGPHKDCVVFVDIHNDSMREWIKYCPEMFEDLKLNPVEKMIYKIFDEAPIKDLERVVKIIQNKINEAKNK